MQQRQSGDSDKAAAYLRQRGVAITPMYVQALRESCDVIPAYSSSSHLQRHEDVDMFLPSAIGRKAGSAQDDATRWLGGGQIVNRSLVQRLQAAREGTSNTEPAARQRKEHQPQTLRSLLPTTWKVTRDDDKAAAAFEAREIKRNALAERVCRSCKVGLGTGEDLSDAWTGACFNVSSNRFFVPTAVETVKAIAPRRRPEKPFDLSKSIWAPRVSWADSKSFYDTDQVELRRFETDWPTLLAMGLGTVVIRYDDDEALVDDDGDDVPDEVEQVGETLWRYHDEVHCVFTYYAALGLECDRIALNQWTQFTTDFKLVSRAFPPLSSKRL